MITGVHALLFTPEAARVRSFLRHALGWGSVDAGGGWLIFALPPAELGVHPAEGPQRQELYLMCDDIEATVRELAGRGVELARPISEERFGLVTAIKIPGGELPLYQPNHPIALK